MDATSSTSIKNHNEILRCVAVTGIYTLVYMSICTIDLHYEILHVMHDCSSYVLQPDSGISATEVGGAPGKVQGTYPGST